MASLNKLLGVQRLVMRMRITLMNRFWKMHVHPTARISMTAKLDKTYPAGVHVGRFSYVAFGATILCHDMTRGLYTNTRIGDCCFIGARSLVMPGVTVGDNCIVAAGAVVTRDVPDRTIVAGNPAVVIRSEIEVGPYGRFIAAGIAPADQVRFDREMGIKRG